MAKRQHPERDLHKAVAQYLALGLAPEVVAFHIPNGELRHPAVAARLKGMGVLPGVFDWCIMWPGGIGWIEMKASGGRLSHEQEAFAARVADLGQHQTFCRSLGEVVETLTAWRVPRRPGVRLQP